jgi:hypothetical protein
MAEHSAIQFEDVSLEEARRMGRGPRMEPMLYDSLRKKIESLSDQAARVRLGADISPIRMKNYVLRIGRDVKVPVTVRRVPGGIIFWRSTDEDIQQAKDVAGRLRTTRQKRNSRNGRRRQKVAR